MARNSVCSMSWLTLALAAALSPDLVAGDFFSSHSWERSDVHLTGGKCRSVLDCHRHGDCIDRFVGVQGNCRCHAGWVGEFCSEKRNTALDEPPITSSGIKDGRAEGGDCKANADCNSPHGFCVRGKCECFLKAKPPFCGLKHVVLRGASSGLTSGHTWCASDSNCQQGGTCVGGNCNCPTGFTGPWCNDAEEDEKGDAGTPGGGSGIHDKLSMLKAKLKMLQLQKSLAALQEGGS